MNHTPGPWKETAVRNRLEIWANGMRVAIVEELADFDFANARLIAKTPQLRDALKHEADAQNCTCRLLGFIGEVPPCGKCKLDTLIAETEGR